MRTPHQPSPSCVIHLLAALLAFVWATPARAGSTGSTELFTQQGGGAPTNFGDYTSASGGLATYYSYFIEVPPGLSQLQVDIFDADVGAGGSAEADAGRDRARGSFDSSVTYSLRDPDGTVVASATLGPGACGFCDNSWAILFDSSSSSVVTFQSLSTNTAIFNTTSLTIDTPPGTTADDLLIAIISKDDDESLSAPAGWTTISEGESSGAMRLGVFYRIATASEPASHTFTWSGSEEAAGGILRYSGVDTSNPIDISGTSTGTSDSPTAPSVTTTVDGTMIVRAYGADDDDLSASPYPPGHTGRFNIESSFFGGTTSAGAADTPQASAGATGAASFSLSASEQWRAVTVAIRPEPSASTTPVAGHWELRIDMSPAVTGGDDINALGIRAHDGDAGAGGTELPVYYYSFGAYGTNPAASRSYTNYPYITSGCSFDSNDFDYDGNGTLGFSSRTGAFSTTNPSISGNDAWLTTSVSGWTSDNDSVEYGVWSLSTTIDESAGEGNYGVVYLGNSSAASPPPSAQPEANTFRVYIPTDDRGAPVEPYVEQFARHLSGPNPPQVGETTRATVTVRVVNPTALPISFSNAAGNVVTVNVPGGGAVYAGSGTVQLSQGSIISQPAAGGTGDVVWDPGTVAAGTTALLAYDVDIIPTSSGQRIPVTGTPASNGTTATWVDTTCTGASPACSGTQLATATYAFGPLCEVAVTEALATYAAVASFETYSVEGTVVIEWQTSAEVGTVGFNLYRFDAEAREYEKLNERPLLAVVEAPQGGTYRFADEAVSVRSEAVYLLEELDNRGRRHAYGPFLRQPVPPVPDQDLEIPRRGFARSPHRPQRGPSGRSRVAYQAAPASALSADPDLGLFLSIEEAGLYQLSAFEIASYLGINFQEARALIANGNVSLTQRGEDVAWVPARFARGLYFYGQAIDSPFTRHNVYRLRVGAGQTMASAGGTAPLSVGALSTSPHTEVYEEDQIPLTVLPLDPESDYWFWDFVSAGDPTHGTKSLDFEVLSRKKSPGLATLRVRLQGATASDVPGEHHAVLRLNGFSLGEAQWEGLTAHEVELEFSQGLLRDGVNSLEITGILEDDVPTSIFFVDSFELTYERLHESQRPGVLLVPDGSTVVAGGFSSPDILVLAVDDPLQPALVESTRVDAASGAYRVAFEPDPGFTTFFVASTDQALTVTDIRPARRLTLASADNRADYLIVTAPELSAAAADLADYRESRGLESKVVTVAAIVDEFNHGIYDPRAIRSFLAHAYNEWTVPPSYVLLLGTGHLDYRDLFGLGGNLVPPLMTGTQDGIFASDNLYGDFDGDGAPEVSLGRIPAETSSEAINYLDKLIGYEKAATQDWMAKVIVAADPPDGDADFSAQSDAAVARLGPAYSTEKIYLSETPLAEARARLFGSLRQGSGLINFLGHGGMDRMGGAGLLTSTDVASLDNESRLPVVAALSCLINRFALPGFRSLGTDLLLEPQRGAVAVWSPTGLSFEGEAAELNSHWIQAIQDTHNRLGDAVRQALFEFGQLGGHPDMVELYLLFGDPALEIHRPAEQDGGSSPPSGE